MRIKKKTALSAIEPKSIWTQPLILDTKSLSLSFIKGIGHLISGKFDDLADDGVEALNSLGIESKTPETLIYSLLQRSIFSALASLLKDSKGFLPETIKAGSLEDILNDSVKHAEIGADLFNNPSCLQVVSDFSNGLKIWLVKEGVSESTAHAISNRFSGYFPYALHGEWQQNSLAYEPIKNHFDNPFTQAVERELSWEIYSAYLQKMLDVGIFDEPFGLRQIYVPLNGYYEEKKNKKSPNDERTSLRVVIDLNNELTTWLSDTEKDDAVRAISGGPGSGKSSFAKVFAAEITKNKDLRVLLVPLHLIDPTRDFIEEVGRFVRDENILKHNPIHPETREPNLLIILDGLDELASQGKAAAQTARDFIRTVQQCVDRANIKNLQLRVLFCGREVVMQGSESEFRKTKQVLTALPYFNNKAERHGDDTHSVKYQDVKKLLETDLRHVWWKNYGALIGKHEIIRLPEPLERDDLDEVTSQPLLNYLLALSYCRGKLDFSNQINLNQIYYDLIEAVYTRGYEKGRKHSAICHLASDDFFLILEEIGLAAWHGDGRTTTIGEIEQHCIESGLKNQLDVFQEGAKHGITRLLAAFFFRQHGERAKGDPTFVFTHKSFGEYLVARRIVRGLEDIVEELERREKTGRGKGWSEIDALERWCKWCGPTAMSRYIHKFLLVEVSLREKDVVNNWQRHLCRLMSYVFKYGMPMEKLHILTFQDAMFQTRNAEESLLAALNACARKTETISNIDFHSPTNFGAWFRRIQGQRTGPDSVLASFCLSWLSLKGAYLDIIDLWGANLAFSDLSDSHAVMATFNRANLSHCNLTGISAYSLRANTSLLTNANLTNAELRHADFSGAIIESATFENARLEDARFEDAHDVDKANFSGAKLEGAKFSRGEKPKLSKAIVKARASKNK